MRTRLYVWGAIPLCLGLGTLVKWVMTRQHELELIGLCVIGVGALSTVGFLISMRLAFEDERRSGRAASVGQLRFLLPTLLMLANYPVAFGCVATYDFICSRAYVRIQNASGMPLDEIILSGSGQRNDLGRLEDGATRRAFFLPRGDSGLLLSVRQGQAGMDHAVSEYLIPEGGKEAYEVVVGPGLEVKSGRLFR